jgi:hypothetical protein
MMPVTVGPMDVNVDVVVVVLAMLVGVAVADAFTPMQIARVSS